MRMDSSTFDTLIQYCGLPSYEALSNPIFASGEALEKRTWYGI